jgi:hypothetical protein
MIDNLCVLIIGDSVKCQLQCIPSQHPQLERNTEEDSSKKIYVTNNEIS